MKSSIVLFILIFILMLSSCNETTQGVGNSPGDKKDKIKILVVDDSLSNSLLISLYPNPSHNYLNLGYSLAEDSQVNITVQSIVGDIIVEIYNHYQGKGDHKFILAVENLQSGGVYILQCETGYGAKGIALFEVIKN